MNYGRAFQIVRAARGLTLADVAKNAGIGPSQLSLVENGKRSPSLGTLEATCRALDVPVLHLMVLAGGAEIEPQMAAAILKNLLRKSRRVNFSFVSVPGLLINIDGTDAAKALAFGEALIAEARKYLPADAQQKGAA